MRIAIGSDHAGFPLKEEIKGFSTAEHRDILDLGTHSTNPVDYSDYAAAIGRALRENRADAALAPRWPQIGFQGFAPDCVTTPIRPTKALSTTT